MCAVLQVTDVALEPGEAITSVSTGDNLRWSVEAVVSGEGPAQQPHLIIKPFDRGMTTSVVVTTTRRSYHLTLRSTDQQYMHAVSFTYPGEPQNQAPPAPEQKPKVNVALTEEPKKLIHRRQKRKQVASCPDGRCAGIRLGARKSLRILTAIGSAGIQGGGQLTSITTGAKPLL